MRRYLRAVHGRGGAGAWAGGLGVVVVGGATRAAPFPAVTAPGRLRRPVSELTMLDAPDRDHPERVEAALAAGELPAQRGRGDSRRGGSRARATCGCETGSGLSGHGARCAGWETTHVLPPSWSVPRQRGEAELIGQALRLATEGKRTAHVASTLGDGASLGSDSPTNAPRQPRRTCGNEGRPGAPSHTLVC